MKIGMHAQAVAKHPTFDNRIHGGRAIQHSYSPLAAENSFYLVYP